MQNKKIPALAGGAEADACRIPSSFFCPRLPTPSFRAKQADFSESVRSCELIGLRSEESLCSLFLA